MMTISRARKRKEVVDSLDSSDLAIRTASQRADLNQTCPEILRKTLMEEESIRNPTKEVRPGMTLNHIGVIARGPGMDMNMNDTTLTTTIPNDLKMCIRN